jgi:putative transposase
MQRGLYKNKYRIKTARHEAWDYSKDGFYFVTICTEKRKIFFGDIKNGLMVLNEVGEVVKREWLKTEEIRENVKLDEFVVMPNHIHGIIQIIQARTVETHCNASLPNEKYIYQEYKNNFGPQIDNLSTIIRGLKGAAKNIINSNFPMINFAWQERFNDRIIRNDIELNKIRQYIIDNPLKWDLDRNNPKNL